jgi:signal transduction histidine kinase
MTTTRLPTLRVPDAWANRTWAWFEDVTQDLTRVRQRLFEGVVLFSALLTLIAATPGHMRFFTPQGTPVMRVVLLVWAGVHVLAIVASRRHPPARAYLAFLLAATLVLELSFSQVREPWGGHLPMRWSYLVGVLFAGFTLLPLRLAILLTSLVAGIQAVSLLVLGSWTTELSTEAVYAMVLPAVTCGVLIPLAGITVERSQRRLAQQNAWLEAQVADRAAIIERQQQALHQCQKLDAVGTLAAGLAHDFNNLLVVILGFSRELRLYAEPGDPVRAAADAIDASARRAADLTQRLLGSAGKGKVLDIPIDLHEVLESALSLVGRNLGDGIRLRQELVAASPFVKGDPVQVQQVLVNLVLNARDAMPSGGELTIRTHLQLLQGHAELSDGVYLQLEVHDTGLGIPPAIRDRVFDPFFTTKPFRGGTGTGLGLAMVYGICKANDGTVWLESEQGRGTSVRVLLPVTEERPGPVSAPVRKQEPGRGVLVVVAEDEVLAGLAQRVRALLAAGPEAAEAEWLEARAYVLEHARDLELMLLDRGRAAGTSSLAAPPLI